MIFHTKNLAQVPCKVILNTYFRDAASKYEKGNLIYQYCPFLFDLNYSRPSTFPSRIKHKIMGKKRRQLRLKSNCDTNLSAHCNLIETSGSRGGPTW